jgi:hypothetical protein
MWWLLFHHEKKKGLGSVLVIMLFTQNLVSIVIARSIASRDASLLPLTRLNGRALLSTMRVPERRCQGLRSNRVAARSVLYNGGRARKN